MKYIVIFIHRFSNSCKKLLTNGYHKILPINSTLLNYVDWMKGGKHGMLDNVCEAKNLRLERKFQYENIL